MKLFKKGDLNIRYIVLVALGLIVLIVIAIIFMKGSNYFVTKIKAIWDQVFAIKPQFSSALPKNIT